MPDFTPKDWRDSPDLSTPITAAALEDMETRLSAYSDNYLMKVLSADAVGTDTSLAQPWFPVAGGVLVAANKTYLMTGLLALSRAAGIVSHTTGLLFGGTAALSGIQYEAIVNTGDVDTASATNRTIARIVTNTTVKAASTAATEQISFDVIGIIRVAAAGTFIPQFMYSAAPGGAPTVKSNSFFRLQVLGAESFTTRGTWA